MATENCLTGLKIVHMAHFDAVLPEPKHSPRWASKW